MGESLGWRKYLDQLDSISKLDFNFDDQLYHASKDKSGWFLDRYTSSMGFEKGGAPILNGPFEAIKVALANYTFADPRLIKAVFDPEAQLPGRNMLLLASFAGLNFTFGVRITKLIDEVRVNELGQQIQVWGYAYRTLKGHFEVGEIRFEVSKNIPTGEVNFMIDSYSKPDRIKNPFYRIGFRMFGRSLQKYFAKSTIERLKNMAQRALVKSELSQDHEYTE